MVAVDQVIQDLRAQIRHSDFVLVGVAEGEFETVFGGLDDLAQFTAGVLSGFDDEGEEFFFENVLHIPIIKLKNPAQNGRDKSVFLCGQIS